VQAAAQQGPGGGAASDASGGDFAVTVNVGAMDPNEASSKIAQKIQGPLRDALQRQQRELESAARGTIVRRHL
jgi:hypothetical protein